jgi:DNA-binding transcriptional MerR regulator
METLTISRLAHLGGVNLETVRYYERRGLLPKPPRTQAGYRQFSPEAARRLRFIKRAQELGFSLDEVQELLALRIEPRKNRANIRRMPASFRR